MGREIKVTIACSIGEHNVCLGTLYGKGYPMSANPLGPCQCEVPGHVNAHKFEKEVKDGDTGAEGQAVADSGDSA